MNEKTNLHRVVRVCRRKISATLMALIVGSGLWMSGTAFSQEVRFAVIGDYGTNSTAERDVSNLVKSWNPEFIITTGDNNYPDGAASTIDRNIGQFYQEFIYPYKGTYGPGATQNRFFPTLGNHDWNTPGAKPYLDYFTLPGNERYYDFVWGPVHFFAVDSDTDEPDGTSSTSKQARWLQERLAASTSPWKVVFFHHPAYSSSSHGSSVYMRWPFAEWGASIVLAGHDHVYERLLRDGFPYITNGLGGRSLYGFSSTPLSGSIVRYNANYGAQRVTASETRMRLEFINREGTLIDSFTLSTSSVPPGAPTDLNATATSADTIALSWADNSQDESGFTIERSTDGTTFVPAETVGVDVDSARISGLLPSTTYFFRVRAFKPGLASEYSNVTQATTFSGSGGTDYYPNAPSTLEATAVSPQQIDLTWADNSGVEDGYEIVRSSGGGAFEPLATVGPNIKIYSDTGLAPGTTYSYRVRAFNGKGASQFSNIARATTYLENPDPPSGEEPILTVVGATTTSISISWTDPTLDETAYRIEVSPDGLLFSPAGTLAANSTQFTISGLEAGTTYFMRVSATGGIGGDVFSNVVSAATLHNTRYYPNAPSNLTATAGSGQIDLLWTDNSVVEDGYQVIRSTNQNSEFELIGTVAGNVTTFRDFQTSLGVTYFYRVRAFNSVGASVYSNVASAMAPNP